MTFRSIYVRQDEDFHGLAGLYKKPGTISLNPTIFKKYNHHNIHQQYHLLHTHLSFFLQSTSMSSKKIIAVVGATGNQGSSVVHAFLQLPSTWTVRALTRNPSSANAQALAQKGCEVVKADLEDPNSLAAAFEGVHAVFLNTDFWQPYAKAMGSGQYSREEASKMAFDTEVMHATNAANAAAVAAKDTLERFVYSALGPMKKASGGKYPHCGHWDAKAAAADYIEKEVPGLREKISFFYPTVYSTNSFLLPQQYPHLGGKDGQYTLLLPAPITTHFQILRERDSTGPFVRCLIEDEEPGLKLLAYDCEVDISQAIEDWQAVTGKSASFVENTEAEMHESTGLPYEVLDGPAFLAEYDFMAGVEGKVVKPADLKKPVPGTSYKEILESRKMDDLIGNKHPEL